VRRGRSIINKITTFLYQLHGILHAARGRPDRGPDARSHGGAAPGGRRACSRSAEMSYEFIANTIQKHHRGRASVLPAGVFAVMFHSSDSNVSAASPSRSRCRAKSSSPPRSLCWCSSPSSSTASGRTASASSAVRAARNFRSISAADRGSSSSCRSVAPDPAQRAICSQHAGVTSRQAVASFVSMIGAFGYLGWLAPPCAHLHVALTALELLVACLQAYVFTI